MWIFIGKNASRLGTQLIRQASNFADDLGETLYEAGKTLLKNDQENKKKAKSLRIAILGLPNAGKSTLINSIVGRPLCPASAKVHTTKIKAAAVYNEGDTQLVFLDTPGIVSKTDLRKWKLEQSLFSDPLNSLRTADMIGVVHDVSNFLSRKAISDRTWDLIKRKKRETNMILILNKIDVIKKKEVLLELVRKLTKDEKEFVFADVFMVSALTDNGVKDLRNYLLASAKDRQWDFEEEVFLDQPTEKLCQDIVRAKLLDNLPNKMPYDIKVQAELIETLEDGSMNIVMLVKPPCQRISRFVIGKAGGLIKKIAQEAEEDISAAFQTTTRLRIIIPVDEKDSEKTNSKFKARNKAIM